MKYILAAALVAGSFGVAGIPSQSFAQVAQTTPGNANTNASNSSTKHQLPCTTHRKHNHKFKKSCS